MVWVWDECLRVGGLELCIVGGWLFWRFLFLAFGVLWRCAWVWWVAVVDFGDLIA